MIDHARQLISDNLHGEGRFGEPLRQPGAALIVKDHAVALACQIRAVEQITIIASRPPVQNNDHVAVRRSESLSMKQGTVDQDRGQGGILFDCLTDQVPGFINVLVFCTACK